MDTENTQKSSKAPIALFVYKRPVHTEKTLESLTANEGAADSDLFIFSDGPKGKGDGLVVEEVRKLVKGEKWCGTVTVIERERNMGLANSIISGVTDLCEKYGRVIVLEDDLIVSRWFLEYMNNALDRYENSERVMEISAHMFPVRLSVDTDAVFFPFATSWGWATWRRAWKNFDKDSKGYESLKKDRILRRKFDLDGAYPFFDILKNQLEGKVDSWGIRWYLSIFKRGGLTLFPARSLVHNIGFDGSGTHTTAIEKTLTEELTDFRILRFPLKVEISEKALIECKNYLKKRRGGFFARTTGTIQDFIARKVKPNLKASLGRLSNVASISLKKNYLEQIKEIPHFYIIRSAESKLISHYIDKEEDPFLDLGCGDGSFGGILKLKKLYGIDIDAVAVARATKQGFYKEARLADASYIPFAVSFFATVFSNCAIEHMEDIDSVLKEVLRVLKNGGKFIFTAPSDRFLQAIREDEVLKDLELNSDASINEYNRFHHHLNILSADEWKKRLEKAGFKILVLGYYLPNEIGSFVARMDMLYTVEASGSKVVLSRLEKEYFTDKGYRFREKVDRYLNDPFKVVNGTHLIIKATKP